MFKSFSMFQWSWWLEEDPHQCNFTTRRLASPASSLLSSIPKFLQSPADSGSVAALTTTRTVWSSKAGTGLDLLRISWITEQEAVAGIVTRVWSSWEGIVNLVLQRYWEITLKTLNTTSTSQSPECNYINILKSSNWPGLHRRWARRDLVNNIKAFILIT